jgi:aldose 1-epimerase
MSVDAPPSGKQSDLHTAAPLGDRVLDRAFTDLDRGGDGRATVTVGSPGGPDLQIWLDPAYRYLELFTGDSLPDRARRRRGLGVEPMTAAPDAVRSGDGLVALDPGHSHTAVGQLRPAGR